MAVQLINIPVTTRNNLPQRFERKYYLGPAQVDFANGLLRQLCLPAEDFPSEQINSLYFDTPDLDQHERSSSGDYYKDKVRIRWYGKEKDLCGIRDIFLELKSRQGFASTKQRLRLQVPAENILPENLGRGIIPQTLLMNTLYGFGYFPSRPLLPVIMISYWRYRYSEIMSGQRVSLDCRINSTMIMPGYGNGEKNLELPGGIIEIKGQSMELPETLRHARILYTDWTRFSKYSACIDSHTDTPGSVGQLSPSGRVVRF